MATNEAVFGTMLNVSYGTVMANIKQAHRRNPTKEARTPSIVRRKYAEFFNPSKIGQNIT
jgi:hypothetical protein